MKLNAHNKGRPITEWMSEDKRKERAKNISETRKEGYRTGRIKVNPPYNYWLGKKFTQEHKEKISLGGKGRKVSEKNKEHLRKLYSGRKVSEKERLRLKEIRLNQVCPVKDTKIEVKIQNYLEQLGVDFFTHKRMKEISHEYQCDIFVPSRNLIIECDGDYWHHYPVGREIDRIRTNELIEKGFKVLRLWEREINVLTINELKNKIGQVI